MLDEIVNYDLNGLIKTVFYETNDFYSILFILSVFIALELSQIEKRSKLQSFINAYRTNIGLFLFNSIILSIFSTSSLVILAEQLQPNKLLSFESDIVSFLVYFLLFDLILYFWHRAAHHFEWLWLFHQIHHSEKTVNVTTAFRMHLVELLFNTMIKALFILMTGLEAFVIVIFELISSSFIMFHHLNMHFKMEKHLGRVIITPSLHKIHHSINRFEHDNNFGAVFSIWDRIFHSFLDQIEVTTGLTYCDEMNFNKLLKFCFTGKPSVKENHTAISTDKDRMIAEAAYYKAESRGFAPGFEILDWVEAEQQINKLFC